MRHPRDRLRTDFLTRRQYMTTLGARWEKPDYTGVTAEVPLGHVPHPKIRPLEKYPAWAIRHRLKCLIVPQLGVLSHSGSVQLLILLILCAFRHALEAPRLTCPNLFWADCSPVWERPRLGNLQSFLSIIASSRFFHKMPFCKGRGKR